MSSEGIASKLNLNVSSKENRLQKYNRHLEKVINCKERSFTGVQLCVAQSIVLSSTFDLITQLSN